MDELKKRYEKNNGLNNIADISKVETVLVFEKNVDKRVPFVTICIPTFRRVESLTRAVASVLLQKNTNDCFELIIVDNDFEASSTSFLTFLEKNAICNVKYFKNKENVGMFGNWNKCLQLANADWVCMLHDDDEIVDTYVRDVCSIIRKYKKRKIGYIKTNFYKSCEGVLLKPSKIKLIMEKLLFSKIKKFRIHDFLIDGNAGSLGSPTCGTVLNKKAFYEIGGYSDKWGMSSDVYSPFLLMKQYDVCFMFKRMGKINFGANESCRDQTVIDWVTDYLQFQKYLSSLSPRFKRFNNKYGDAQITLFIRHCLTDQKKDIDSSSSYDFLNNVYSYDNCKKVKKSLINSLKFKKKIHALIFYLTALFIK